MKYQKLLAASILALSFLLSLSIIQVQAAAGDSSINLKKDPGTGLFILTIKDPDGIQEFLLFPTGKNPYGGGLSGCKRSFSNNTAVFDESSDFTPVMPAYVIDCKNNKTELEIPPPVKGITASVALKKEVPPPPPPPPPPPQAEKKEGPLAAEDIRYPVAELGNCQSETECRSYCDIVDNAKECFTFAKKYHLISDEEAKKAADEFLNVRNGPGGCNSGKSCEDYCSTVDHLDECIAFAEKTGYYSPDELAEARKFQALVKAGTQFPGGCKDRNTCEIYCGVANHMEECLDFAEKSGFMPPEEIAEAKKFMALMRQGESPGGCTSKEQCENYCFEESHINECIAFAEKAGVMSAEEAEMARKVGGKGPGGCRSKTQCEAYCETNSEECFNFAKEKGLISENDLEQMREGMARFREELDKMPPEAVGCMKDAVGEENFNKMIAGEPVFDRSLEEKMKSCFGQLTAQVGQQLNTLPPEAAQCIKDSIGEDGLQKLQSGELDQNIDFSSLEVCFQQLQSSFSGDGGGGPGGCKSIDECTAYCQEHQQECQGFGGGPGGGRDFGDSFLDCVSKGMTASYVCGINGKGAPRGVETTYFNECHAKQHGVEILHEGVCVRNGKPDVPCSDIADPVCGNDNNTWVSACHAEDQGGGVQYEGVCRTGGGGGFPGGPGGCKSQEECQAYCQEHPTECGGGTPPPPSPTSSCVPPPSGLVSWWSADLASGVSVPDINNKHSGAISGRVTVVPMEVGSAFEFDGSSGYINMGNPAGLNFGTGPFSLEAWFNWDGGGGTVVNNIIRKSNYGSGPGSGYWLRVGAGTLEFSVGATTQAEGQTIITTPVSSGVWHHAVAAKDDSGDVKLYVDGESQGAILRQSPNANSTSEAPFLIGAWSLGGGVSEFFHGQIDEIAIYNRALGASEAKALFDAGSIGKCATSYGRTNRELPQDYQQQNQQQQGGVCPEYVSVTQCPADEERFLSYDSPGCQLYSCRPKQQQFTPELCANFTSVPACSYVGSPDSQNYKLCIQCYPDKINPEGFVPPSSSLPPSSLLGTVLGPWLELLK